MRSGSALARSCWPIAVLCWLSGASFAQAAECETTDEGRFPCEFRATDTNGSFEISAPGKPTYILNVEGPGVAFGFVNLGDRNVALPGRYLRSQAEPGMQWRP